MSQSRHRFQRYEYSLAKSFAHWIRVVAQGTQMIFEQTQRREVGDLLTMGQGRVASAIKRNRSIDVNNRAEFSKSCEEIFVFAPDRVARVEPIYSLSVTSAKQSCVIRCGHSRPKHRFESVLMNCEMRRASRRGARREQICDPVVFADHLEIANRKRTLRMRYERVVEKVEAVRCHEIVVVLKRDEFSTRESSRVGSGVSNPLVRLNVVGQAIAITGHKVGGCIGGTVVQHDDLDRPILLREHRVEGGRQHVRTVVATDDDRYQRSLQDSLLGSNGVND